MMLAARFLVIASVLGLAIYFVAFNPSSLNSLKLNLPQTLTQPIQNVAQSFSFLPKILGFASTFNLKDLAKPEEIQKVLETLPGQLQKQILQDLPKQFPKLEEILTNTKKEELFLKAPQSFTLPEIKVENYDQEITVQLDSFEIKDTRGHGNPWILRIEAKDLIGEKGKVVKENVKFRVKSEYVEVLEGNVADLIIKDGASVSITTEVEKNKGHFKIKPLVTILIPQGSFSGSYTSEIESTLE